VEAVEQGVEELLGIVLLEAVEDGRKLAHRPPHLDWREVPFRPAPQHPDQVAVAGEVKTGPLASRAAVRYVKFAETLEY
jgi:hypothetical protein